MYLYTIKGIDELQFQKILASYTLKFYIIKLLTNSY